MSSKTNRNLWIAFIEEAKANRLYTAYALKAREEGFGQAAAIFERVAADETRHALSHLKALGAIKSTAQNLTEVIAEESAEAGSAFPRMIEQVKKEGNAQAVESLTVAMNDSFGHIKLFQEALASVGGPPAGPPSRPSGGGQGESLSPAGISGEISEEKGRIATLERIREVVFGLQDGLLSTMAVGATVMLATNDRFPTLIAALASALAGTISMASGTYLGSKSEKELHAAEIEKEREELRTKPDEEVAELLQVLRQEGYTYEEALAVAERVGSDPELMLKTQAEKELGLALESETHENPLRDAAVMGLSFFAGCVLAILPYAFLTGHPSVWTSIAVSLAALFCVGAAKSWITRRNPWLSGLEVFAIGSASAALSFLLGDILPKFLLN